MSDYHPGPFLLLCSIAERGGLNAELNVTSSYITLVQNEGDIPFFVKTIHNHKVKGALLRSERCPFAL